jgi:hypothetical protein
MLYPDAKIGLPAQAQGPFLWILAAAGPVDPQGTLSGLPVVFHAVDDFLKFNVLNKKELL